MLSAFKAVSGLQAQLARLSISNSIQTRQNSVTNIGVIFSQSTLNLTGSTPLTTQHRHKGLNFPRLRNPHWFVRKERTIHDEQITPENTEFAREVIQNTYGQLATPLGVALKPTNELIRTLDLPTQVQWRPHARRTGVIAKKIGQYPLWKKDGTKIHTTLLQIVDNHVIKYTPPEEFVPTQPTKIRYHNKLGCLLVGTESVDPSLMTKEYCGLFKDSGVMPKKKLGRFMVSPEAALPPGTPINVSHFRVGDYVDVRGQTVDRGFQGVMKRHGFKGMPASHGVTKTHRRGGNIGAGGAKARVWPGTKMPGHMGNRYRILRGLKVWRINTKYNVMWVQGLGIAGSTNDFVYVFDTMLPLKRNKTSPPFPTHFEEEGAVAAGEVAEDVWDEELHNFKDATVFYQPE